MSGPAPLRQSTAAVYCGSGKAIAAAAVAFAPDRPMKPDETKGLCDALIAMHHPDLGLDRSVCLRDVVEALRNVNWHNDDWKEAADYIERVFGGAA